MGPGHEGRESAGSRRARARTQAPTSMGPGHEGRESVEAPALPPRVPPTSMGPGHEGRESDPLEVHSEPHLRRRFNGARP